MYKLEDIQNCGPEGAAAAVQKADDPEIPNSSVLDSSSADDAGDTAPVPAGAKGKYVSCLKHYFLPLTK